MDSERKYYMDESYLENPPEKELNLEIEDLYNRYKKLSWENKINFKKLLR